MAFTNLYMCEQIKPPDYPPHWEHPAALNNQYTPPPSTTHLLTHQLATTTTRHKAPIVQQSAACSLQPAAHWPQITLLTKLRRCGIKTKNNKFETHSVNESNQLSSRHIHTPKAIKRNNCMFLLSRHCSNVMGRNTSEPKPYAHIAHKKHCKLVLLTSCLVGKLVGW